jgi:tartrate dehydratase alpha subunit/fumarate hydratase class I-like protein
LDAPRGPRGFGRKITAADCKVVPITTAGATGRAPRNLSPVEQRAAEMDLARTEYRQRQLRERGIQDNTVEDALRDCNRR